MERKRIIFVDDDPSVLESMQRIFFDMDDEWEMEFAGSGHEALEYMKEAPFDVIISDMRMPEMDGAALLSKVQELYPATVRFILSGFSDQEMIMRTVGPADQFLTKPCDPEVVKKAIVTALDAQNLVDKKKLRAMASQMRSLPTLPALYVELKEAIESQNSSFQDIAKIVQYDIAITAKVLQLVNSAFFGLRNRVDNLQVALTYLGLESLKGIVLTTDVFSKFTKDEIETFDVECIYKHSIFVSMLARTIVATVNKDQKLQDVACMAGMLHDVGKLVFIRNKPKEYAEVYQRAKAQRQPIAVFEKEAFGVTHADIGGYLMSTWGLPEDIVKIISMHHGSVPTVESSADPLSIVYLSNILAHEETQDRDYTVETALGKGVPQPKLVQCLPAWRNLSKSVREMQDKENDDGE